MKQAQKTVTIVVALLIWKIKGLTNFIETLKWAITTLRPALMELQKQLCGLLKDFKKLTKVFVRWIKWFSLRISAAYGVLQAFTNDDIMRALIECLF